VAPQAIYLGEMTDIGAHLFLTPDAVAEILSISVSEVYSLLESGELLGLRVGQRGPWRIEHDQLERFIQDAYAVAARVARWNQAELANIPELADGRII
jgi:excisionase family DNA binding protein